MKRLELKELVELTNGYAFKSKSYSDKGYFVMRISNVQDGYIDLNNPKYVDAEKLEVADKFILSQDDILISLTGYIGRVGRIEKKHLPAVLNQRVAKLQIKSKEVLETYLFHFLKSSIFRKELELKGKGAAQQNVSTKDIKSIQINLPSIEVQKKIVSKLDQAFEAIDQAIANTEKNIENVEDLRDSYSEQCFKRFPSQSIELGEVCHLFQGLAVNAKTKHLLVESSSLPLLRIKDLRENTVSQFISEEGYPPNSLIDDDDIIYTRTGSLGLVFRGRRGILHNNSFKVSPKDSLSKDFLFHYLQLPSFKKKILSLAQRAAQLDITHKIFKKQVIPMLSHENQKIIVNQVEAIKEECSRLKEIQVRKLAMLEELKMSILEKAFNGELV